MLLSGVSTAPTDAPRAGRAVVPAPWSTPAGERPPKTPLPLSPVSLVVLLGTHGGWQRFLWVLPQPWVWGDPGGALGARDTHSSGAFIGLEVGEASARTAWSWGDSGVLSGMQRGSAGQGARAGSEGREQQRLSRTCCAPGAGGTQGRSGERCCPVGRGLMRLWDRSATLLSAAEESRCAPPLLRAALRTLSEPTELKRSGVVVASASARLAVLTRVAQGSVRVASPGLSPAGCRALAPPAEAQEAVPAATGASCRNFLCRRGMTAAWPCANLSVGDNCHGKVDGASVATTLSCAVPFILPLPSC